MDNLISVLGTVALVVLILFLAWWCTRLISKLSLTGGVLPSGAQHRIQVLEQVSAGKDQKLQIVGAAGRWFLLGWTASCVTVLAEFTAEEAQRWQESGTNAAPQPTAPDFRGFLLNFLNKKNK